ncbi:MAG TPA: haloacid dehalogenase-like hydrolase, partial [Actinomycetospora sp.]|nr:haloacid dehalogenase-like hydrolase [Actinomycetospora sp.]
MSDPDASTATTAVDLMDAVAAAPDGPQVGAFFDFDGTVIAGYSVTSFMLHHVKKLDLHPRTTLETLASGWQGLHGEEDFRKFLGITLRTWAGRTPEELEKIGKRLFRDEIGPSVYPEAWRLIRAHLEKGHTVV